MPPIKKKIKKKSTIKKTIKKTVPVRREPDPEPPYERCCFCRTPTPYWTTIKGRSDGAQVACCPECAKTHSQRQVPSKKVWCERERLLTPRFTTLSPTLVLPSALQSYRHNEVTGMLFVRDTTGQPIPSGRRLVMVVGVLAVPADADLPGEHQFVVLGSDLPDAVSLTLMKHPRINQTELAQGRDIGHMLLKPIWRT